MLLQQLSHVENNCGEGREEGEKYRLGTAQHRAVSDDCFVSIAAAFWKFSWWIFGRCEYRKVHSVASNVPFPPESRYVDSATILRFNCKAASNTRAQTHTRRFEGFRVCSSCVYIWLWVFGFGRSEESLRRFLLVRRSTPQT